MSSLIKVFDSVESQCRIALKENSSEVMTIFTNFKNGNNIQLSALTLIIQYYHRFIEIMAQNPFKTNPNRSDLINIHQLMVEVKKYKTNF